MKRMLSEMLVLTYLVEEVQILFVDVNEICTDIARKHTVLLFSLWRRAYELNNKSNCFIA